MKANQDIRETLSRSGVKQWELAERIGKSEAWLSKKLRRELTSSEKVEFFVAIGQIEQEKNA